MPGIQSELSLDSSILSCLCCMLPSPTHLWSWRFPLPLGYSTSYLLDTGLLLTSEKIYQREEEGRDAFCEIFQHFPYSCYFPHRDLTMGLKMGLNYGWRLCLTQCGRWIGNTGKGGSVATLGRGMHLEFLTWGTLERGISCFERLLFERSAHSPYLQGCRFLHASFSLVTER